MDLLNKLLYDQAEDEAPACPSSRHDAETENHMADAAQYAIARIFNISPFYKLKELAEKVRQMRDVQVRYFAATAEDRAAAKMEGKHWMWKPKGSLAPELLKLSKQLEGEVDILLAEISKGGDNG
jgi:hypothetical protein